MSLSERAKIVNERPADLIADVTLYDSDNGGRKGAAPPGWGCPTAISTEQLEFYDAWPQLGGEWLQPNETRRVGFVFFSPEGAEKMKRAEKFYLWEGGFIGEAVVVSS